jgi:hypothetical protein
LGGWLEADFWNGKFQVAAGGLRVTIKEFRRLALGLPEATEGAHMAHPDSRVRNKIFATIWPDEGWAMVKLTPGQQELFVESEPGVFVPVKGGWGRRGATHVKLPAAKRASVRNALAAAWRNVAPKSLAERFDD